MRELAAHKINTILTGKWGGDGIILMQGSLLHKSKCLFNFLLTYVQTRKFLYLRSELGVSKVSLQDFNMLSIWFYFICLWIEESLKRPFASFTFQGN